MYIGATCYKGQNVQDYFLKVKIMTLELLGNKPDIKFIKKKLVALHEEYICRQTITNVMWTLSKMAAIRIFSKFQSQHGLSYSRGYKSIRWS